MLSSKRLDTIKIAVLEENDDEYSCHGVVKETVLELVNAVEKMREALEKLMKSEVIVHAPFIGYSEAALNAKNLLKELFTDDEAEPKGGG